MNGGRWLSPETLSINCRRFFMHEKTLQDEYFETDFGAELTAEEVALLENCGLSRRQFLEIAGAGFAVIGLLGDTTSGSEIELQPSPGATVSNQKVAENAVAVKLKINGAEKSLNVDSRVTLLDALRERLNLTGSKKGCDHGQCGACTVIVDGRRVLSCLTLAATCEGKSVTTIEGLATGDMLHPVQAAFIEHDGFQCGYCTPGQICSAVAMLDEAKRGEASYVTSDLRPVAKNLRLSDEEIRERMSGNLCRCSAYNGIVAAIRQAHAGGGAKAARMKEAGDAAV